jgi:ribosomal protein S18 acetylase RimI-like enzyme
MPPDDAITIRLAMPEDAVCIHSMMQGLAEALELTGQNRGTVDDLLKYGFGDSPLFKTLIAERGAQAVGMCTYFPIFSTWTGRPGVFVLDLFVSENQRGSRLGEMLLAKVASIGRREGAAFLRLSVDNHNIRGQNFYHRIGFKAMKDECSYQINTEKFDALADQF